MICCTITDGIKVSMEPEYMPDFSNPMESNFMFSYRINIENCSRKHIKLLSRKWTIVDSNGDTRIVEGEGVIGEMPIIPDGEEYQYISGVTMTTDTGYMFGTYTMVDLRNMQQFEVKIPVCELYPPFKMN